MLGAQRLQAAAGLALAQPLLCLLLQPALDVHPLGLVGVVLLGGGPGQLAERDLHSVRRDNMIISKGLAQLRCRTASWAIISQAQQSAHC
jgi:hypothetical protein